MKTITIEVGHEEHDGDIYYHVYNEQHILVDKMYNRKELMLYLKSKIKITE